MISEAATLWIRGPQVPVEKLKSALAQEHDGGAQITFWRRSGLTVVHVSFDDQGPEDFHSRAQSLAEALEREVFSLSAFTGSASGSELVAFDAEGRELWNVASPRRPTAESRRIEKALGLRFVTAAQLERLEDRDEDPTTTPRD
jgi:sugar (pentulose or hexulose) kinase